MGMRGLGDNLEGGGTPWSGAGRIWRRGGRIWGTIVGQHGSGTLVWGGGGGRGAVKESWQVPKKEGRVTLGEG